MLDWNGWFLQTNFVWRNIVKQTIHNRKALLNSFQSSSFILWEFTQTHFVRHKKVLVGSFHLNGHTLGFNSQTQNLEPPCLTC